ncbi:M15 family metallopeptidase [Tessaracoccus oleiagri]|uniref:D-alanyl-D-alanine carboxypeptidase n=1 Tax=Tessaracoccus oleiagri TaxID=686624 RepID=A0A1G9HCW6_9ACTN|nr:M15 family metallopeptidase [Tessaracoccus oleiagri]SDL10861.1 D-alanyl-D-alanine carboxypeptidase [Tessaracoccus oleiagri]
MRRTFLAAALTAVAMGTLSLPTHAEEEPTPSPSPSASPSEGASVESPAPEPTASPSAVPSPEPTVGPSPEQDASPTPSLFEPSAESPAPSPEADPSPAPAAEPQEAPAVVPTVEAAADAVAPLSVPPPPTAHSAGIKLVGLDTYTWGRFQTTEPLTVWTEVLLPTGWSTSQIRTTDATGYFTIPLTYGSTTPGTYRWRVAGSYPGGQVVRSGEFELWRLARPTVATAGSKAVGLTTYAWGRFDVREPVTVRTQVLLPSGWSTSQIRTTDATGYYAIPLTYGATTPGTYRWRVTATYEPGGNVSTAETTLTRVAAAAPSITRTTTAEVSGYWTSSCPVEPSRLSTIRINHWDYSGNIRRGEIIVRDDLASQVSAVLQQSFDARFPFAQMRLPSVWGGDDIKMMAANDTSGFNCRKVVGNPYAWSPHAYGIAVDINPRENPYRDPSGTWYPNATYAYSRPAGVTGMLYSTSTPVRAFQARGWRWESGWDWHHFQKVS